MWPELEGNFFFTTSGGCATDNLHVRLIDKKLMKKKCLHRLAKYVLIAALLPISWAALEATGGTAHQGTMVLQVRMPPFQIIIENPDCLGTTQLDLYSIHGESVGKAIDCVTSVTATTSPIPVRELQAHFTFDLPTGQIEAAMIVREMTLSGSPGHSLGSPDILQTVQGIILGGNGSYTGLKGTVRGGGSITFTAAGPIMDVRYVLYLK